jgi:hypothetical protein
MKKRTRTIAFLLLAMIGFLFLKNLWLHDEGDMENCGQIAHIHFFHIQHGQTSFDDECHGDKALSAFVVRVSEIHLVLVPASKLGFYLIFDLENGFKSLDIEPRRRPPKNGFLFQG